MPAVFVHGNPETDAIWGELIGVLDRSDVVCLSPPGFGAPVPEGWTATREAYVEWLAGELEGIDGPADLVGHDWGGGHVMGVVATRPELVRSWCSDVLGIFHPEYVWHDLAQAWLTPGDGEALVEQMMNGPVDGRAEAFQSFGITPEAARSMAEAGGDDMGRCILALYRSAPESVLRTVDLSALASVPGLAIFPREDTYVGTEEMVRDVAAPLRAEVAVLEGVGHWWMQQDPAAGARTLTAFWNGL